MSRDILTMVEILSNQKELPQEDVFRAVEAGLAAVAKKQFPATDDPDVHVVIDRETGDFSAFRRWTIVDLDDPELDYLPGQHYSIEQGQALDPDLTLGGIYETPIEAPSSARISAQTAKHVILQKVREAERNRMAEEYEGKIGELITGVVKRTTRESVLLDLGNNAEVYIAREDMLPRETVRLNDRIRAYLTEIRREPRKSPQLIASRTCPEMLVELFRIEVPEIGEETIHIMAVARDPGLRAKIAVKTNDGRIDPIGACIGMRGARVQAVSNELNGERVDIILWEDNPAQLVINAMAPAEVTSIVVNEEKHSMDIAVAQEQLSQAIGRSGQNVRLASVLTGWALNVMSESDAANKTQDESANVMQKFIEHLDVDEDIAAVLVEEGFASLEEIAYVDPAEMINIEGFDEEIAQELQNRAKTAIEQGADKPQPEDGLLALENMTPALAQALAAQDIMTQEDLAECAVDEITNIDGITDELAAKLIMAARAPWFE
jgi:transcription termination/antitermination protein NusA